MAGRIILVIGGTRSGKSRYAEELAVRLDPETLYVATAQAGDDEMRARIKAHQTARPPGFRTLEVPYDLAAAMTTHVRDGGVVLIDCLTLLASNLMAAGDEAGFERRLEAEMASLIVFMGTCDATFILVTSEVGLGIVPQALVTRRYRDALGRANQQAAAAADEVYFIVAGLAQRLK